MLYGLNKNKAAQEREDFQREKQNFNNNAKYFLFVKTSIAEYIS